MFQNSCSNWSDQFWHAFTRFDAFLEVFGFQFYVAVYLSLHICVKRLRYSRGVLKASHLSKMELFGKIVKAFPTISSSGGIEKQHRAVMG